MVTEAAEQKAEADKAVANDDDRGENRLARFGRILVAIFDHRGHDRDLDNCHGDREHERAIGFARLGAENFGVLQGGEDGPDQQYRCESRRNEIDGRWNLRDPALAEQKNAGQPQRQRRKQDRANGDPRRLHAVP